MILILIFCYITCVSWPFEAYNEATVQLTINQSFVLSNEGTADRLRRTLKHAYFMVSLLFFVSKLMI